MTQRADSFGPAPRPAVAWPFIESALAVKSLPRHDGGGVGEHLACPQTGQPGVSLGSSPFWVRLSLQFWVGVSVSLAMSFGRSVPVSQRRLAFFCLSLCLSLRLYESAHLTVSFSLSPCLLCLYLAVSASHFLFRASWSPFFSVSLYCLCFCLMDGGRGGERGLIPSRGPSPRGLPHHWLPGVQTPHSAPIWRFPGRSPSVPQFAI